MKRTRVVMIGIVIALALIVGFVFTAKTRIRDFFYPTAPKMPATVDASISEVLAQLESVLRIKAPHVLESMQPGLTSTEIANLEKGSGLMLPDEIKALYQWRNGSVQLTNAVNVEFIPIHRFVPLDEALAEKAITQKQIGEATFLQRAAANILAGHTDSWICLFSDGAGDGYYFDPNRQPSEGAVFYCFAETGSYTFFPSVKNLLAYIAKAYEKGAFYVKTGSNVEELDADFDQAAKIIEEFGSSNHE